jgi:hypothetical protein
LVRQDIAERAEFPDFELAAAHRLDLGVVAGCDIDLDLAAELFADHLPDLLVNRHQAWRRVVGFDAEPHRAAFGTIRVRRQGRDRVGHRQRNAAGHDPKMPSGHPYLPECARGGGSAPGN